MAFPLIPAVLVTAGAGVAWYKVKKRGAKMTPARKKIYAEALRTMKDPVKLRSLAADFEKEGLKHEAVMLRKRADLRAKPEVKKQAHADAFRKGMNSKDPKGVMKLADMFRKNGAVSAASKLTQYAKGLVASK